MRAFHPLSRACALASLLVVSTACAAVSSSSVSQAASPDPPRPTAMFGLQVGSRWLDDDVAWEDIENPFEIGFDAASVGDPLGIEGGLQLAGDSTTVAGVDVTNTFIELFLGGRATFGNGPLFPYIGAGGTALYADVEGEAGGFSLSDDDFTFGLYVHGGLLYRITSSLLLGADVRWVGLTSVDIFGIDTDADYTQLALVLGWCH